MAEADVDTLKKRWAPTTGKTIELLGTYVPTLKVRAQKKASIKALKGRGRRDRRRADVVHGATRGRPRFRARRSSPGAKTRRAVSTARRSRSHTQTSSLSSGASPAGAFFPRGTHQRMTTTQSTDVAEALLAARKSELAHPPQTEYSEETLSRVSTSRRRPTP